MDKNKEIEEYKKKLLSPSPLESLKDLETLVKPLPGYVGPGEWLKLLK